MRIQTLALSVLLLVPTLAHAQIGVEAQVVVPGVSVNIAPPPAQVEVMTARPSPSHVWIPGHQQWEGGRYVWIGGHWAMPPSPYHRWVPARWAGGRWWPGHWQYVAPAQPVYVEQQPAQEVVVEGAPPAEIVEVQPAMPGPGHIWAKGHWYWNGYRYQWAGGHWEAPRAGWRWEHARWENRGGRWYFARGGWRR